MTVKKKAAIGAFTIAALAVIGTAIVLSINSPRDGKADSSTTPLGGLFGKAASVSRLKDQMRALKNFYPALVNYARAHQDEAPASLRDLKPYLPAQLTSLDDEAWELPSRGKLTLKLTGPGAASEIILQQKNVLPGKPKIIVFGDGHIEYKP